MLEVLCQAVELRRVALGCCGSGSGFVRAMWVERRITQGMRVPPAHEDHAGHARAALGHHSGVFVWASSRESSRGVRWHALVECGSRWARPG